MSPVLHPEQFRTWHVANPRDRASISTSGLLPGESGGMWAWGHKSRALVDAGPKGDVWEINGPMEHGSEGSAEWGPEDLVHVSHEAVPSTRLRLVRSGRR